MGRSPNWKTFAVEVAKEPKTSAAAHSLIAHINSISIKTLRLNQFVVVHPMKTSWQVHNGIWEQEAGQASQRVGGRITGSFIIATAPEFNQTALETSNTLNDLMAAIHNLAARKDPTGETTAHSHIPIQKPHLVG